MDKKICNDKYLAFHLIKDTGKTKVWDVASRHSYTKLGTIKWYAPWRRYSFYPEPDTLFDCRCMTVLIDFITAEMDKRKGKTQSPKKSDRREP